MGEIYDIAPTAKFMNMWEAAGGMHGGAFVGVGTNQHDDGVVCVTKGRVTHRIKWLFSSKYRNWVKAQRRSFVEQIETGLSASLSRGSACAFFRADMKFKNDAGQKAEQGMKQSIFDSITQDLKAASASAGNEKAFLRSLSVFFHKTRERVVKGNAQTLGGETLENSETLAPGGGPTLLTKVYKQISRVETQGAFVRNENESDPVFRLQLNLNQYPELINDPRVAQRVVHGVRTRERGAGSGAQNKNLNFECDRAEPVVFAAPSGPVNTYATLLPRLKRAKPVVQGGRATPPPGTPPPVPPRLATAAPSSLPPADLEGVLPPSEDRRHSF